MRYGHARQGTAPCYSFGHGQSYTSFCYANLKLTGGHTITASFDVTNSGALFGSDTPQVYLVEAAGRKTRRLIGFGKVALAPGATGRVTVTVDPRLLASFDPGRGEAQADSEAGSQPGWRIDAGRYRIVVGPDAATDVLSGSTNIRRALLRP